jgi:aerobic carbon-monoxide dehydrogenase small subunit
MKIVVNGRSLAVDGKWEKESLLCFLREKLDLTGAREGCGTGACGTCTVLVDGTARPACRLTLGDVAGNKIVTIEGMTGDDGGLHPLQQAFIDHGAVQCGFCTPGMILRAHAFLLKNNRPSRGEIRRAISPNLCRCTGYQQIIDAIDAAAWSYGQ